MVTNARACAPQTLRFLLLWSRNVAILILTRRCLVQTFTAYLEWDPETKLYVGFVPGIPGAHSQGKNLDELQKNLKEVLELCLEEHHDLAENLPRFVGLQQIEVSI